MTLEQRCSGCPGCRVTAPTTDDDPMRVVYERMYDQGRLSGIKASHGDAFDEGRRVCEETHHRLIRDRRVLWQREAESYCRLAFVTGRARGRTEGVLLTLAAVIGLTAACAWLAGRR